MQIKVFTIPLSNAEQSEAETNKFLRSHRVLQAERHFCADGEPQQQHAYEHEPQLRLPPCPIALAFVKVHKMKS